MPCRWTQLSSSRRTSRTMSVSKTMPVLESITGSEIYSSVRGSLLQYSSSSLITGVVSGAGPVQSDWTSPSHCSCCLMAFRMPCTSRGGYTCAAHARPSTRCTWWCHTFPSAFEQQPFNTDAKIGEFVNHMVCFLIKPGPDASDPARPHRHIGP